MMEEPDGQHLSAGSPAVDSDGTDSARAEAGAESQRADERLHCANCGAVVPEGARSCPVCRHGVYRTCYCGWRLPAGQARCPNCGADWSQAKRVARKSKSRTPRVKGAIRSALLGALIAALGALLLYALVTGLASMAVADEQPIPTGIGARLDMAAQGIGSFLGRIGAFFVEYGATIALVVGIMAVGAAAGVAVYVLRRGHHRDHSKRTSRRVRRKRR